MLLRPGRLDLDLEGDRPGSGSSRADRPLVAVGELERGPSASSTLTSRTRSPGSPIRSGIVPVRDVKVSTCGRIGWRPANVAVGGAVHGVDPDLPDPRSPMYCDASAYRIARRRRSALAGGSSSMEPNALDVAPSTRDRPRMRGEASRVTAFQGRCGAGGCTVDSRPRGPVAGTVPGEPPDRRGPRCRREDGGEIEREPPDGVVGLRHRLLLPDRGELTQDGLRRRTGSSRRSGSLEQRLGSGVGQDAGRHLRRRSVPAVAAGRGAKSLGCGGRSTESAAPRIVVAPRDEEVHDGLVEGASRAAGRPWDRAAHPRIRSNVVVAQSPLGSGRGRSPRGQQRREPRGRERHRVQTRPAETPAIPRERRERLAAASGAIASAGTTVPSLRS